MHSYDSWKTTAPEGEDAVCECEECACELFVGDEAYNLDDAILCEDCFVEKAKLKFKFEVEEEPDPRDEREWDDD